jgi:putative resolvase
MSDVDLTEWARLQGVHPQTYRWSREGTLPVPAMRVNSRKALRYAARDVGPARPRPVP